MPGKGLVSMKHDKLTITDIKWLMPLLVLIFSVSTLYNVTHNIDLAGYKQVWTKAELNAVTYADYMVEELNRSINITNSLKHILISEDGKIEKFDAVAERMMTNYVQSIQLAPAGVVKKIYPAHGNEVGKIDLVHDKTRGEIVRYGIKNHVTVMQGPFELKQGGYGIAIRNPVYLQKGNGKRYFWGLTIVIIRVPEIFNDSVKSLSEFGYHYRLYKTESPLTKEFKMIDSSKKKLTDPVSRDFKLGGCTWKIEVMPKNGWSQKGDSRLVYISGIIMITLLEGLTFAFLIMGEQRKQFKKIAVTDGLTGLFNRTGFNEQLDHYIAESSEKKCVGILLDVDNFKFINDVRGHSVGDKVLKQLSESMKQTFCDNAVIGRNGGDEFCIVLKDCSVKDARQKIESFSKMERIFRHKGKSFNYSISLGYAEYPTHAKRGSELFHYADIALYEVKLKGKNGCLCYANDLHTSKRTQLGFKLNDVSLNLPGAFFIYRADRSNDEILYANQEMINFVGCSDLDDFFEFTGRQFRNLVHPEEIQNVEEDVWRQINSSEDEINDYVQYRLVTKNGTYKNVLDFGRIVDNDYYGSVFYVLLVDYYYIRKHSRKVMAESSDN